jgi:hypothetical protein
MTIFENRTETLRQKTPSVKANRRGIYDMRFTIYESGDIPRVPRKSHIVNRK